ncbi:MAG: DMT family transporter [Anaerolineales bacterium]|nr:DMT family transporter [Anaerolineales bacterium]
MDQKVNIKNAGIYFAVGSAILLGTSPIFGKQAILAGLNPLAVVAARTAGAAFLLFLVILIVKREYLYIFPLGLLGCLIAGALNGLGSMLYYASLVSLDASLGQFLFTLYPIFVAGLLYLDGSRPTKLTVIRLMLSIPGVYLLTQVGDGVVNIRSVVQMLCASCLYAIHIPINQRVLFEVPAPTVTLYTLLAMTGVTVPAFLIFSRPYSLLPEAAILPIICLTFVTFLSRLTLFAGVQLIGGIQTSLFGLAELLVTVSLAYFILSETMAPLQWMGAVVLITALLLAGIDRLDTPSRRTGGWLYWLRPPMPRRHERID